MPAKIHLEITAGPAEGERIVLDCHDTYLFGRQKDCRVRLPAQDPKASRQHFILEVNPPDASLRDLGSRNGTYINLVKHGGRGVDETPEQGAAYNHAAVAIKHGDRIQVGQTVIRVQVELPPRCKCCDVDLDGEAVSDDALCANCRELGSKAPAPSSVHDVITCERCRRNVADEVAEGRRGQYICAQCRQGIVAETSGAINLLREVLEHFVDPKRPKILGYDVQGKLGEGGMGVVYKAVRTSDNSPVAIKLMLSKVAVEERARKLFAREIDVTQQLSHSHVVSLIEHGSQGGAFFFVMDFCNGGSLDHWMAKHGGKLPLSVAGPIMMQVLEGLQYAHEQRIIHRDLKPQNILMQQVDRHWMARITDFGLAKNFDRAGFSSMTTTGQIGGTLGFMPREQITHYRELKPVSDVWSIAATFYCMLSGAVPRDFPRDKDAIRVLLNDAPVPLRKRNPAVPIKLAAVIDRALDDNPAARPQSARELAMEIGRCL